MAQSKQWHVDGKGFYLAMYCREAEIPDMLEQAGIPQTDIVGYHEATLEEWKAHLLSGKAKLVAIRGRAVWIGGYDEKMA